MEEIKQQLRFFRAGIVLRGIETGCEGKEQKDTRKKKVRIKRERAKLKGFTGE